MRSQPETARHGQPQNLIGWFPLSKTARPIIMSITWATVETKVTSDSESISAEIGSHNEAAGRYRYALFGITDVYCLFKVDPTSRAIINATIFNSAREESLAWGIDYEPDSSGGNFGKTGSGDLFEIPAIDFSSVAAPAVYITPPTPPEAPTTVRGSFLYELRKLGGAVVANGDSSMNSVDGKTAPYLLTISVEPAGWNESLQVYRSVKINYYYEVQEGQSDWTQLRITGSETITAPYNYIALAGTTSETITGSITGKNWNWNENIAYFNRVLMIFYTIAVSGLTVRTKTIEMLSVFIQL